jgi:hypothetical protein
MQASRGFIFFTHLWYMHELMVLHADTRAFNINIQRRSPIDGAQLQLLVSPLQHSECKYPEDLLANHCSITELDPSRFNTMQHTSAALTTTTKGTVRQVIAFCVYWTR